MMNDLKNWIGLLGFLILLTGCGGEEPPSERLADQEVVQTEVEAKAGEVMIEITGWEYKPVYQDRLPSKPPQGEYIQLAVGVVEEQFDEEIDVEFAPAAHSGRYLLYIDPPDQADAFFQAAKEFVDSEAKKEIAANLEKLQSDVELHAKAVEDAREQLRKLQEQYRGQPKDNDTQLLFRLYDKTIRESLKDQIDAEKQVKAVERQIEREQYVTLQRVQ